MIVKQIYKYVKQPSIEETKDNNKLIKTTAMYLAGISIGIGAAIIYKKRKLKKQAEHEYYLDRLEEYIAEQAEFERQESIKQKIQDDLENKVEEFNNRRLSYENEQHASREDLERYSDNDKVENDNKNIYQAYKEDKYDKYEIYDEDLKNQE